MKLLYCPDCEDVFKLDFELRVCKCGKCSGKYLKNGMDAVYDGGIPLGFDNDSLLQAIEKRPNWGLGKRFTAFVIPEQCKRMWTNTISTREK